MLLGALVDWLDDDDLSIKSVPLPNMYLSEFLIESPRRH